MSRATIRRVSESGKRKIEKYIARGRPRQTRRQFLLTLREGGAAQ